MLAEYVPSNPPGTPAGLVSMVGNRNGARLYYSPKTAMRSVTKYRILAKTFKPGTPLSELLPQNALSDDVFIPCHISFMVCTVRTGRHESCWPSDTHRSRRRGRPLTRSWPTRATRGLPQDAVIKMSTSPPIAAKPRAEAQPRSGRLHFPRAPLDIHPTPIGNPARPVSSGRGQSRC